MTSEITQATLAGKLVNDITTGTAGRILAAARELYSAPGGHAPTMDEVANASGVGRATLYRYFENRDELLLAVLEQEAMAIAARVENKIRNIDSPAEHVVEGMVQAMAEIQKNALTQGVFRAGNGGTVNRLLFDTDRLVNIGVAIMGPVVERARETGDLKTDMDPELVVEWILRILLSLVTVPSPNLRSRAAVRRFLNATVLPVLRGW